MSNTRVVDLGGVFIKARDPKVLRDWYRRHLGLDISESYGGCVLPLKPKEGAYQVFSIFGADSDYCEPKTGSVGATHDYMLNFRVADLHGLIATLRAEGCVVEDKVEDGEYGKFGWVIDPEGRRVELWQPPE